MQKIGFFIIGLCSSLSITLALAENSPANTQSNVAAATPATDQLHPLDIAKLKAGQTQLNVGHYNQLPPFYYASNPQPGFGYDIFNEVAKKAGIPKVNFIGFDSNVDLNIQLQQGIIDVIANSWDLPGMRKHFLLTEPYYTHGGLSFLYFKQKGSFKTLDDLKDHTVGVFKHGYADLYWLPTHGIPKNSIKTYPSIKELMIALREGDIDVALIYYPLAELAQQQLPDQLSTTLIQPINDVYAVRLQDGELSKILNEAIQSLSKDGTLNKIQAQYMTPPVATGTEPSQG